MMKLIDSYHPLDEKELQRSKEALQKFLSRTDIGFPQIPQRQQLWDAIQNRAQELRQQADDLVVVGIGGSSLGPKALYEVLENPQSDKRLFLCDNVDAIEFEKLWKRLRNPSRTTWVIISKSGGTIETLVAADLIQQKYKAQNWNFIPTVVSETRSNPLTQWAQEHKVPTLEIPVDVGGRFSVLTAVGMLPMAFLGFSAAEFQQGAKAALQDQELVSRLMTYTMQSFQREEWITFFMFYASPYQGFGRWLQQLWAESLAKPMDRAGKPAARVSSPFWGIGSIDQHSVLQQLMEGAHDKLIVFSRFKNVENAGEPVQKSTFQGQEFFNGFKMGQLIAAQAQGTRQALNDQKVSTLTLEVEDMSPKSLGYQIMLWQLVVAGLGERININAFDQPGVELGKRLAKQILKA